MDVIFYTTYDPSNTGVVSRCCEDTWRPSSSCSSTSHAVNSSASQRTKSCASGTYNFKCASSVWPACSQSLQKVTFSLITYLLMPFHSLRPSTKECHLLHFSLGVSHLLCFFFRVSLPGVSWPTCSSQTWGVPCDGLTGECFWWFPECMSYPPPFSLLYFLFCE